MKYALNIADNNRILSACIVFSHSDCDDLVLDEDEEFADGNYDGMPIVEELPEGDISEYRYVDGEFIHEPISGSEVANKPTQLDIIEAQVTYTAMMTDTLLEV